MVSLRLEQETVLPREVRNKHTDSLLNKQQWGRGVGGRHSGCMRQCQVVSGNCSCSFLPLGTRGPAGECEGAQGFAAAPAELWCSHGASCLGATWSDTLLILSGECPRVEPMKGALICSLI